MADFMPAVGEAPIEDAPVPSQGASPGRATAAKSQAKRKSESESQFAAVEMPNEEVVPTAEVKEEDRLPDDDVPVEDAAFEKLKLRRYLPGAQTSEEDFTSFFTSLQTFNATFQVQERELVDTSETILHKVRLWTEIVTRDLDHDAPDYLKRLAVGVLAFGRCRQADLFLREHALIYWVAEGGKTLRFHAGDCYMKTPSGAFQQHRGVPPDHDRVQTFLLHVEGIFRQLPGDTRRTTEGLLQGVRNMWADVGKDILLFLDQCVDACLRFQGDRAPIRGRRQGQQDQEEHQEVDAPDNAWNALTAKTILSVKKQLAMELTQDKLLHYMSEWCDTPKTPEAAVCYEDCAIAYREEEMPPARQVPRGSLEHCYLRIPHAIKGSVPADVVERVQKFYKQTFWGNLEVFKCGQAAQALAKRGLNVVRLFIGLSSGGVGQSLYSTHLHAMYGHNFAFFDPQIWFQEDEMRKQVEQLNGCIILTGQETPGTKRSLAAGRQTFTELPYMYYA